MLVRHFSTNVSGNSYLGNVLPVPRRSEIKQVFDQATGPWPEFSNCEETFSDKADSLHLDFTETDDGIVLEVELSGLGPDEVDVSFQGTSLIIEASRCEEQNKSYYLGDYSQRTCRWTIPVGIEIEKEKVKTLFRYGTVIISIMKPDQISV